MNKLIFSIGFSIFFLALTVSDASACSCIPSPENVPIEQQVKEAYEKSAAVFVGEVTEIIRKPGAFSITVKFKVEKSWNKNFQKTVAVATASDGALCGFEFQIGKKYLVYAAENNKNLATNLCTRTASAVSNKDLAVLDKIKKTKTKLSLK